MFSNLTRSSKYVLTKDIYVLAVPCYYRTLFTYPDRSHIWHNNTTAISSSRQTSLFFYYVYTVSVIDKDKKITFLQLGVLITNIWYHKDFSRKLQGMENYVRNLLRFHATKTRKFRLKHFIMFPMTKEILVP